MNFFLKTACILLLLILFIHSTYSQTFSLERLGEQKAGLEFAYNRTEFENLSHGVEATDHNAHLVVPVRLDNFTQLSIMPCIIYRHTKSGASIEPNLNAGCYLRYTGIYDITVPGFFYRLGGGGNSYTPEATGSLTWIWKGHAGGGIFRDLNKSTGVPLKLFSGLFVQGEFERRIEESRDHDHWGLDISAEAGVELKFLEKLSLSITCSTYLLNTYGVSNFYPKFYFSVRVL